MLILKIPVDGSFCGMDLFGKFFKRKPVKPSPLDNFYTGLHDVLPKLGRLWIAEKKVRV